ncbi:L-serine dehydratase/L-threonine deaminase-like [Mizuhopecten yessoensis]|uniref:L-serine ammonia-lyase n=1 Tax=Mizuhopecten yessoensis TaxID=6573 RepID=A0A210R751_MIZYE|nr:L-serine dehydratase/L-threonine deaminase-like [Mizuhopecten yessoensis]OWF56812.1 L-serine dehydratase/L-threonine deaminase [Mizuhopecten yessoensis]
MADSGDGSPDLYIRTPCIHSIPMSKGHYSVYLKLENLQIPGSFKQRGISHFCKKALQNGATKFVCASGGNAGLAVAYSAHCLSVPATIVLPTTTPELVAHKVRDMGANVEVHGGVWDESNEYAQKMTTDPGCVYVHPFDHPDIWEGHSSMIVEAKEQMPGQPDVVVASVGGGGLLTGVVEGMWNVGWKDVPVIAMETEGAESYFKAVEAGKLVTLPAITSVAKSLGSLTACAASLEKSTKHKILPALVTDQQAVDACIRFSEDHRMLVEPACGASLAAVYSEVIPRLQREGKLGTVNSVLVIVCGGSAVTIDKLQQKFGLKDV